MSETNNSPTFVLVHAAFQIGESWKYVAEELGNMGFDSVHPDLPIDNPKTDIEDHALVIAEHISAVEGPVVIGAHSRGIVVARVALSDPSIANKNIKMLIGVSPSYDSRFFDLSLNPDPHGFTKYSRAYRSNIIDTSNGLTMLTRDGIDLLLKRVPENIRKEFITKQRKQVPIKGGQRNLPATKVPIRAIITREDDVVDAYWSDACGFDAIQFSNIGHFMPLEQPRLLARAMVALANLNLSD